MEEVYYFYIFFLQFTTSVKLTTNSYLDIPLEKRNSDKCVVKSSHNDNTGNEQADFYVFYFVLEFFFQKSFDIQDCI
jgi:hypothetical protein